MSATKVVLNHRNFVIVPESDWTKMAPRIQKRTSRPRNKLPKLPRADREGNRPALAFADVSIARAIIRRRQRLGLSQAGLATLAGVRVEVLNRAERAVTIPTVRTLLKIENVLEDLERRAKLKKR